MADDLKPSTPDAVTERVIGELTRWEREDGADFALIQLRVQLRETSGVTAACQIQERERTRRVFPGLPTAEALAGARSVRRYLQLEELRRAAQGGFAWEYEDAIRRKAFEEEQDATLIGRLDDGWFDELMSQGGS